MENFPLVNQHPEYSKYQADWIIKEKENIMRLKIANIKFIKELTCNGITYEWFVSMKSNYISDARMFVNHENGRTILAEYSKEKLPKTVQNFLENSTKKEFEKRGDYVTYIYKLEN